MAKDLPYFKFNAAEYLNGNITLEDLQTQGVFINICCYYWFKSGCLTLTEIKRRVKCKESLITNLINSNLIKIDGDAVKISFLDEQLQERGEISKINSINGKRGGAPKGNSNAKKAEIINPETTEKQPKTTNKEKRREEEKREEERREDSVVADKSATLEQRASEFMSKCAAFVGEYDKSLIRSFYDYWTEKNEGGRKMRFEMQKVFDVARRLKTWHNNQKDNNNGKINGRLVTGAIRRADAVIETPEDFGNF